uniref:NET domain-containing protein n=2 Tax=Lotharella oceanica TaxID=641309 RepID=A0A7S2THX9_9EUKA|mmetsp:Transcript_1498/g.2835  ORF Transcript_1498/g.2835 Transcript_1498/m.2835 type:complete len:263 (+) Transcript_1498:536-1324(+)
MRKLFEDGFQKIKMSAKRRSGSGQTGAKRSKSVVPDIEALRMEAKDLERKLAFLEQQTLFDSNEQDPLRESGQPSHLNSERSGWKRPALADHLNRNLGVPCSRNVHCTRPHRHPGHCKTFERVVPNTDFVRKQSRRAEHSTPNLEHLQNAQSTRANRKRSRGVGKSLKKKRHKKTSTGRNPSLMDRQMLHEKILNLPQHQLPELAGLVASKHDMDTKEEIELDLFSLDAETFVKVRSFVEQCELLDIGEKGDPSSSESRSDD